MANEEPLHLMSDRHEVLVQNEKLVIFGNEAEVEMVRAHYDHEVRIVDDEGSETAAHGVQYLAPDEPTSCLVVVSGGVTGINPHSAFLHDDRCVLAIGPYVVALDLPFLDELWTTRADDASVFGVYLVEEFTSYIVHGEQFITRLDYEGQVLWQNGGQDHFTSRFMLYETHLEVLDLNGQRYAMDIETGQVMLLEE